MSNALLTNSRARTSLCVLATAVGFLPIYGTFVFFVVFAACPPDPGILVEESMTIPFLHTRQVYNQITIVEQAH